MMVSDYVCRAIAERGSMLAMATKTRRGSDSDWHASMSVALGLGLGFFVLTAVAGVLGVGVVVGYQNTVDLLRQKAELIISAQRDQTHRFLEAAENQVDFISVQISNEEVEPGRSSEFVNLLLGAVSATPQIIRIQFIDENGRLTGVERQLDESIPIFQNVGHDDDLKRLLDKAMNGLQPYWGDLLWRQEYEQAVLNYQRPIIRSGQLLGVMSAWISINQLSEFLSNLESELGANAFILHGRDQVLAHPLMAFGYAGLNRATPLPRQTSYADPVVSAMWKEREGKSIVEWFMSGPQVKHVAYGDLEYVILFDEITGYSDQPWLIATYFESHDMAAEARRLKWAIIFCI
ncbi:MAG: cache domain-containing protein, partial [Gammaproteobacteria bacterium]|nr:cache domain-containing protein [Gammaproteobacteria bacterium]